MRAVTKRLLAVELRLVVLLAAWLLVGFPGTKLHAERISRSVEKLEEIPETLAGREWDRAVTGRMANISAITGGGYNLFVR